MKAPRRREVTQGVLLRTYGVVFLVVLALLVGLTVAIYNKVFVDVVHVTLETDRVGNQLAPPADVKLRGMIVGEVRSVSSDGRRATVDLALQPRHGRADPGQRHRPAAAQDAVRREVRRPASRRGRRRHRLSEGDVITQDRTSTAIELERVLDNLLPLLRTINPGKLNATLNALATALEGRGERLGENLELVDDYFTRLNPQLPTIQQDIVGLADVSRDLRRRCPRPGADAAQLLRHDAARSRTSAGLRRLPRRHRGFATTTRQLLDENGDRIIQLAAVGRPTLALLARYSPEYPCLLQGLAQSERLHRQDLRQRRAAHHARGHPGAHRLPAGRRARLGREPRTGLLRPAEPAPAVARQPLPATARTATGAPARSPSSCSTRRAAPAAPREEQGVVDALRRAAMGVPAGEVPDVATLLFGPMARGTAVNQS